MQEAEEVPQQRRRARLRNKVSPSEPLDPNSSGNEANVRLDASLMGKDLPRETVEEQPNGDGHNVGEDQRPNVQQGSNAIRKLVPLATTRRRLRKAVRNPEEDGTVDGDDNGHVENGGGYTVGRPMLQPLPVPHLASSPRHQPQQQQQQRGTERGFQQHTASVASPVLESGFPLSSMMQSMDLDLMKKLKNSAVTRWDLGMFVEEHKEGFFAEFLAKAKEDGLAVEQVHMNEKMERAGNLYLLSASEAELLEEAELMPLHKSVKCDEAGVKDYAMLVAPFTRKRLEMFHVEPHRKEVDDNICLNDECKCGMEYFSEIERQQLIEHLVDAALTKKFKNVKVEGLEFFALHDDDGQGTTDLKALRVDWAQIMSIRRFASIFNIFAPLESGLYQPLDDIRNYFGDQIGFYFAFLGFYTRWLAYPALFGIAYFIYQKAVGNDNKVLPFYCFFLCIWSFLFTRYWKRAEAKLAYRWGVREIKEEEKERREFRKPENSRLFKSARSQRKVRYFLGSWVLMLMLTCVIISFLAFFVYWLVIIGEGLLYGATIGSILHAIVILILNNLYRKVAQMLNDWENHKSQEIYENRFIQKVFCFEFVNNFMSLYYVVFFTSDNDPSNGNSVMNQLALKLASIFITRFVVSNLTEVGIPFAKNLWNKKEAGLPLHHRKTEDNNTNKKLAAEMMLEVAKKRAMEDLAKSAYNSTLDDYNELVIQYAFVVLFGVSFPLTGILALVSNLLEIYVDSYKLCWWMRRPLAKRASGIPMTWYGILEGLSVLGIFSNTAIIVLASLEIFVWLSSVMTIDTLMFWNLAAPLTPRFNVHAQRNILDGSVISRWLLAFIFEHCIFAIRIFVAALVTMTPRSILAQERRNKMLLRQLLSSRGGKNFNTMA